MNEEYITVINFDQILELARKGGIKITKNSGDSLDRTPTNGIGIKLLDGCLGVLVNVVKDKWTRGFCVESLSKDRKEINSKYYEVDIRGKFVLASESNYSFSLEGTNIYLRNKIWTVNPDETINEEWRKLEALV